MLHDPNMVLGYAMLRFSKVASTNTIILLCFTILYGKESGELVFLALRLLSQVTNAVSDFPLHNRRSPRLHVRAPFMLRRTGGLCHVQSWHLRPSILCLHPSSKGYLTSKNLLPQIQNFLNTYLKGANTYRNQNSPAGLANTTLEETLIARLLLGGHLSLLGCRDYIYVHIYIYKYMCLYVYAHVYTHTLCTWTQVYTRTRTHTHTLACIYECIYTQPYTYIHI